MKSKIPLIVAVVGALLIGGATTGSTRATWTSQAPLHSSAVASGQMNFQVAGAPTAVSLATTSATSSHTLTVTDTSTATSAATNLAQRINVTPDTTGPATATTRLGPCPSSTTFAHVDTRSGDTFQVCVTISATASGSVDLGFTGNQRRGASVGGWSVSHPVTIPVTVNGFGLRCDGSPANNTVKLVWDSAGAGLTYTHGYNSSNAAPFNTGQGTTTGLTINQVINGSTTRYYRVSVNTSPVKTTNVLRVTRENSSTFDCEVL